MMDARLRKGQPLEGRIRYISKNPKLKDMNKKDRDEEEKSESSDGDEPNKVTLQTDVDKNSELLISSEHTAEDKSGPVIAYSDGSKPGIRGKAADAKA